MRLFSFITFATGALGQVDERGLDLDSRIQNAQDKCKAFMDKAFYCNPPKSKISKYVFRLNKVYIQNHNQKAEKFSQSKN